jgi:predicted peptidase
MHFKRAFTQEVSSHYLLDLPKEYDEKTDWPLLVFLHGYGQSGDDLQIVRENGPPKLFGEGKQFPFVLVSPQCPTGFYWRGNVIMGLIDHLIENHSIDPNRIYLTGLSMGGYGTWQISHEYPERFAAIAPVCGGGLFVSPYFMDRLKNLPVWTFHDKRDDVIPYQESVSMVEGVNAAGGNAKLTTFDDGKHNISEEAYNNDELYDWFLKHPK